MLANFGGGMFAAPHGLFVDREASVWVTDFQLKNGKGYTVKKFNPDGKLLMTLGKEGVAGDNESHDLFNAPSNVLIAPDDTISSPTTRRDQQAVHQCPHREVL